MYSLMERTRVDAWELYDRGYRICILTNGNVKKDSVLVMGGGIAAEASAKFPNLSKELGVLIKETGNRVYNLFTYNLISFPTKQNWWEKSDMALIEKSARELQSLLKVMEKGSNPPKVALPRPGCGLGGLKWKDVCQKLIPILGDCKNLEIVSN